MPRQIKLACDPGEMPARLDAWLARRFPEYSREYLKALISEGRARVDGKVPKPSLKLSGGETISLEIPDPKAIELAAEEVALDICYEDDQLLVVNKPRGMLTHPTSARSPRGSLVNALMAHCRDLGGINGELRPGIVHRLDRETSGLLVVAKNDVVQRALSAQFKARTVDKQYFALAHGRVKKARGRLEWPIGRHPIHRTRMRVDHARGRPARTEFRAVAVYEAATLLLIRLHTGRTHQIRVHFAELGHPLVGDVLYASRRDVELFSGVALHSARLSFDHPVSGKRIVCSRPVPEDFRNLIRRAAGGDPLKVCP